LAGIRYWLGRRRTGVVGARTDEAVVARLLEDVGAPADRAAAGEGRREQRPRYTALAHHHAGVELDVRVERPPRLELGEHPHDRLLDLAGEVRQRPTE